jgi:hypothetical protein
MIKCKRCGLTEEEWKKHEEEFYKKHTFQMELVVCEQCKQEHYRGVKEKITSPFGDNTCIKCGTPLPDEGYVFETRNHVALMHYCRDRPETPTYEFVTEL